MTALIPAWVDGSIRPVEKLKVHVDGLRHKAVSVFIMCGNEMLLQRRAKSKYHTPGLWANACCTHPDWNEPAQACAVRRMWEELGVTGLQADYRCRIEYRADVGGGLTEHEVVDVFCAEAGRDLRIDPNPAEVMSVKWIALDDLREGIRSHPDRYTPWLRIYMEKHGDAILGADQARQPA